MTEKPPKVEPEEILPITKPEIRAPVTEMFGVKLNPDADVFVVVWVMAGLLLAYVIKAWIDYWFARKLKKDD